MAFFPSYTLFGKQPCVLIGTETGDILKVDFTCAAKHFPQSLRSPDGIRSTIGGGLPAELLRGHKFPVLYVGHQVTPSPPKHTRARAATAYSAFLTSPLRARFLLATHQA